VFEKRIIIHRRDAVRQAHGPEQGRRAENAEFNIFYLLI